MSSKKLYDLYREELRNTESILKPVFSNNISVARTAVMDKDVKLFSKVRQINKVAEKSSKDTQVYTNEANSKMEDVTKQD